MVCSLIFCINQPPYSIFIKLLKNSDKILQYFMFCDIIYQEIKKKEVKRLNKIQLLKELDTYMIWILILFEIQWKKQLWKMYYSAGNCWNRERKTSKKITVITVHIDGYKFSFDDLKILKKVFENAHINTPGSISA